MKKIEKKGKQKSEAVDAASETVVGKVTKDENDKPLNYIKDEIQSECLRVRWNRNKIYPFDVALTTHR